MAVLAQIFKLILRSPAMPKSVDGNSILFFAFVGYIPSLFNQLQKS